MISTGTACLLDTDCTGLGSNMCCSGFNSYADNSVLQPECVANLGSTIPVYVDGAMYESRCLTDYSNTCVTDYDCVLTGA